MPSNLSQLLTRLCTSSKPKRLTPARKDLNNPEETASPHKLELKDQLTGKRHHFNLYHDRDLPFLQKRNGMMARNIHDATADDDVQTDQECRENAIRHQRKSLKAGIQKFTDSPALSAQKIQVKNLDLSERYEHCHKGKVSKWVESDNE